MPTALCFDAYGTLFDTASVRDRLGERLDAPAEVVDEVVDLWREKQLVYSYQLALMEAYRPFRAVTDAALDYALDYYEFEPRAIDVDAALAAYEALTPYPDVEPTLDRLAEAECRLAVLSNGDPGMLEAVIENAGIDGRFEAVVSADEVETYKPAPAVYERAAERLDEPLADCWLVSANAWDAAGAAQAGMGVAWIDRSGDPPERIGGEPDLTVPTLTDLVDEFE
jgi:2-haloacid dehalogenase